MIWIAVFLASGLTLAGEVKDRCEVKYDRCIYDCVNRYPFDQNRRTGCEIRCKLNYAMCESVEVINRVGTQVREFLEGFTGGG